MRTAYFSSVRRPGVVFLVSSTLQGKSLMASTYLRVKVAVPDNRWRKLSAVRSDKSSARTGPTASATTMPWATEAPSLVSNRTAIL
jgi:hypothetical protein